MEPAAPIPTFDTSAEFAAHVREALAAHYARPLVIELRDRRVAVPAGKPLTFARTAMLGTHGEDVAALIEPLDVSTMPWHAVPAGGLRLWRQHGLDETDGELVTELEAGDPAVQLIVAEDGGWQLVRALDGAQGWIRTRDLGAALSPPDQPDVSRLQATDTVDAGRLAAEALALLDTPYVWGGATDAGVDCSGIVQRAAWRAARVWLPRHSRALLRAGSRVSPSAAKRAGDIFVLQRDPATVDAELAAQAAAQAEVERLERRVPVTGPAVHPLHVAIALGDGRVLHASRDALRVVTEPEAELLARYRVLGVRRLGPTTSKDSA
ncbi:MAG: C40 family peptidase [Thermoleophilia bacterium]|nr:C40 family peptidase [Thermoleophilia bacterium]